MRLTLEQLKEALAYDRVSVYHGSEYLRFDVLPDDQEHPKVYFAFQSRGGDLSLLQAGFGDWHSHFNRYGGEEKNRAEVLRFFRAVVARELYLLELLETTEGTIGASCVIERKYPFSMQTAEKIFHAREGSARRIRRHFFNRPGETLARES